MGFLTGLLGNDDIPPKVAVDVAASAQLAAEDEAPVLPDDFARNDAPQVSAEWKTESTPEPLAESSSPESTPAVTDNRPEFVLYTSDGTWKCLPCRNQEAELSQNPPKFRYRKVLIPAQGKSPNGNAPCWQAPNGTLFPGNQTTAVLSSWARLNGWDGSEAPKPAQATAQKPAAAQADVRPVKRVEVSIDGKSAKSVLSAIAAHTKRMHEGSGDPSGAAGRSWLPEIDVDADDSILKILDAMLSADGYSVGGLKVSWPAGARSVAFDAPIQVRFKKILEVDVEVKSIVVENRVVTVNLAGRFLSELKIRLK
jgi:hypothetical protein